MDTAQWPQEIVVKPMEEIVVVPKQQQQASSSCLERKIRPQKEQALNCPRCNSTNTKFCYYNNYSLSQPRFFCKTCRRYWTDGGSLRNIPVGGGSRKNKRSSLTSSSAATSSSTTTSNSSSSNNSSSKNKLPDLLILPPIPPSSHHLHLHLQNPNNKIHDGQDLNLGIFSPTTTTTTPTPHDDFKTITELIQVPNFDSSNIKDTTSSSATATTTTPTCHLSALELLTSGITPRGLGFNSFLPMTMSTHPTTLFSSSANFPLPEFKPSPLTFALDGLGINGGTGGGGGGGYGSSIHSVQESSGRLLFPFEDLKQVSTTTSAEQNRDQHGGDSTGYWSGILGGGGGGGGEGGGSW